MRRGILSFVVICLTLLVAVPMNAQDATVPRFEAGSCMFPLPAGVTPACGYLVVPEDRSNADSPTIEVAVAIFRSENAAKAAEPLVYLEGGPGGSRLENINLTFSSLVEPFLATRDVIVFDQRGVGRSQPALDCPEYVAFFDKTLTEVLPVEAYVDEQNAAFMACGERLKAEGVNLAAYNSAENAADVNDLAAALGYEQVDLYGISYGTKLALTVMRDFPAVVRSAIIDSIYPLEITNANAPLNFQRSLGVLFADCAASADCNAAYPDLENVFYQIIDDLNANPVTIRATDPRLMRQRDVVFDGDSFAGFVFQALYASEIIPALPKSIFEIRDGDYSFLQLLTTVVLFQVDAISIGMNNAVQCNEEYRFDTAESLEAVVAEMRPELQGFARRNGIDARLLDVCAVYSSGELNPIENQAVTSDIPTLVVSGEYDPITPPAYGQLVADSLANSFFYEFPGMGHGVITSNECAQSIADAFLVDPTSAPDSSCLTTEGAPVFELEGQEQAAIEMEAYDSPSGDYSTVKPVGWEEAIAGTFARGASGLDQTAISFQMLPGGNVDLVIPLVAGQFGVSTDDVETREANGLSWRLLKGELQGIPLNLAITDADGMIYMILVLSSSDETDALYESVFLPAVDAFVVNG